MKDRQNRTPPKSNADKQASLVLRRALVERLRCADPKRRSSLESSPSEWLRHYFSQIYVREFDKLHNDIIDGVMKAYETGGRFGVAGERGIGKSAVLLGMVMYLVLTGKKRFPVYLPWAATNMRRGLKFCSNALTYNRELLLDYPEFCAPFNHAKGISQKLAALKWEDTEEPCGAALHVTDGMIILPDSLGVIGGATINGNPRGMYLSQPDGSWLRPDIALVDDPQDREVALSSSQISHTCDMIDNDVAGMGEAGASLPLLMSGNCIADGDVMAHYLASSNWRSIKVACVESWPSKWAEKGEAWKLWHEWWSLYQEDEKSACKLYKSNKSIMTCGMKINAFNAYKSKATKTLPDAFCVVMQIYWQMGHGAFMAEHQQSPISKESLAPFTITVPMIMSRSDDNRAPHVKPEWANTVIASSDINDYGLSSVINGFANDQTNGVMWYGLIDRDGKPLIDSAIPESEKARQLYDGLVRAGEMLADSAERPTIWGIDAGYMGQVVRRYADTAGRKCGMQIILCRGFSGRSYKPGFHAVGKPREQCHITDWPQIGRGLSWNADYWKEVMQRAWLGDIGKPGSCSLFFGEHRDFAEQIWRERLLGREMVAGIPVYVFAKQPGRHDYGDAMAQSYALAAYSGIGTIDGNCVVVVKPKVSYFVSRPSQRR